MDEKLRKLERAAVQAGASEEDLIRFRLAQVKVGDLSGFDKPLVKWKDTNIYTLLFGLNSETSPVFHHGYELLSDWRKDRLVEFQTAWKDRRSAVERSIVDGEWFVYCIESSPPEGGIQMYFWGIRAGNRAVADHLATRALSYMEDEGHYVRHYYLHLQIADMEWIQPTCLLYEHYSGIHRFLTTDGEVIEVSSEAGRYPYLYGGRGW